MELLLFTVTANNVMRAVKAQAQAHSNRIRGINRVGKSHLLFLSEPNDFTYNKFRYQLSLVYLPISSGITDASSSPVAFYFTPFNLLLHIGS